MAVNRHERATGPCEHAREIGRGRRLSIHVRRDRLAREPQEQAAIGVARHRSTSPPRRAPRKGGKHVRKHFWVFRIQPPCPPYPPWWRVVAICGKLPSAAAM